MRYGDNYYSSPYVNGQYPNRTSYQIGNVQVCVNGTYTDVCNDGLTAEVANVLCQTYLGSNYVGYPYALFGQENQFRYDYTSTGVYNVSCNSGVNYWNGYSCFYNLTTGTNGCNNNGGLAVITCVYCKSLSLFLCLSPFILSWLIFVITFSFSTRILFIW